ncbi:MAG: FHIPEP family type III secretion protein, partial [Myxococcota bacterium]
MKAFEILCGAGRLRPEVVLVAGVGSVLGMLVVPLPSSVLDVLLATHLAAAVLILVAVLVSGAPLAVSSFPTLLLFTTLFRLALNVSTTRLILSEGAAGEVVLAFGHFVARGDVVTGLVVFLILTLVQLMVIGKGAERVAEVGARFTLDALPGKQMSIDAALRSGAVTESEAEDRRRELARESQFYGAMDGAMKFVKGDATLSLLVTALNLVVGLGMGVWRLGLDLETAAETFALLTIGDGLVSQLPSLLIALASGVVTTRVRSGLEPDETLGRTMQAELFGRPQVLALTALLAGAVGVVPGLPTLPFVLIASLLAGAAVVVSRGGLGTPSGAPSSSDAPPAATGPPARHRKRRRRPCPPWCSRWSSRWAPFSPARWASERGATARPGSSRSSFPRREST